MRAPIGTFEDAQPATERLGLLPAPVAAAVTAEMIHVDTDPAKADTADFVATYGEDLKDASANCVVVAGKRGSDVTLAACLVLATTRLDVNGTVRRHLGVRKASFAPMETAVSETGMEYGGITPVGLPAGWPLLVDSAVAEAPYLVVGSGARRGKLIVPGKVLAALPGAVVLEGLATPVA
ncbi:YbaK/EbsC family protein [Actinacidiphila guanduensis]|jgi:prolyl-tRNA editing enzyme YbaK/EbsC (Cys-tRNA(Pro) deacylase)|uniref:Cys-tRNA(Pro) deacylase, prolyl-tRNA editing enzyme YbaK/EbsC n=1 Tax=Actinacidiphila guanduensis TaxID=310781 RepID=A0A1H0N1Z6_9ACTN|nr:YbaK/EbsC family protein [Actinacidiphila guanduensis]SDO86390.1 Cys-tRNA(Pro) deacylase, prolyl-tRNA editing enzyme YbaK/EbsC [Actinacidiphila guanduensis]